MRGTIPAPRRPGSPYNLLDNSDFGNPVNQREQTSYTGNMIGIDRWTAWSKNGKMFVGLEDGRIRVWNGDTEGGTFGQKFPQGTFSSTKSYTFAYKRTDGKIYIQNNPIEDYPEYGFQAVNISLAVNQTYLLVWAALYEGEYTADTLPPYTPKGYATELAACQRYYWQVHFDQYETIGMGYEGMAYSLVQLSAPVQMRTKYTTLTQSAPVRLGNTDRIFTNAHCNGTTIILGINYPQIANPSGSGYGYSPEAGGVTFSLSAELQ